MGTAALVVVRVVIVVGLGSGRDSDRAPTPGAPRYISRVGRGCAGDVARLVGLLLAFGLTMAVGRYRNSRAIVVQESNDIGTTFLRAQMLAEPGRTRSLDVLEQYADLAVDLANQVPGQ